MRVLAVFVALLAGAHGAADKETTGKCLVDSGEAISDAMDAAMFMWAAVDRCEKAGEAIKCSVGILSTVQSVNGMLNVVLKTLHKCGDFMAVDAKCTLAGLALSKASAGVGATAANVAQHCETPNATVAASIATGSIANGNWPQQDPAQCIVDVKDTLKNLFKAIRPLLKISDKCAKSAIDCTADALDVVAALSGFGGYLAGAVGHCSPPNTVKGSVCAEASIQLVEDLTKVAQHGIEAHQHCTLSPARLFSERQAKIPKAGSATSTNLILAALIPVTAFAGFVGGGRLMKSGDARSVMSDNE
jgi:hypothetical protein